MGNSTRFVLEAQDVSRQAFDSFKAGAAGAEAQLTDLQREVASTSATFIEFQTKLATAAKFTRDLNFRVESIGKSNADLMAMQAAQLGVASTAAPMIAKLRETEAQVKSGGMSAAAYTNALRGVPAQVTDIVTSLQAGQRPLSVFLQQGGQLKDMFGGIGPAARALGGYLLGLVNPYVLAAGAVGVLAYAYMQGSKETEAYNKSLILSGNIAGTTSGQLADMARTIGTASAYTQGQAAETLASLTQSGVIAGDQLKRVAEVALEVERATGQAVSKTIEIFKGLKKEPLEASVKLNEEIHHLTATTYEHIRSLDLQGRTADASRVAIDAYLTAMSTRSKQVTENLSFLETSLRSVTNLAKGMWDAIAGIGRATTGSEQLAALKKTLADREARGPLNNVPGIVAAYDKGNQALRDQIALLERLNTVQVEAAKSDADRKRLVQEKAEFDKRGLEYETKAQKLKRELAAEEIRSQELLNKGLITQAELTLRLNNIREKYKESGAAGTGQNEVAAIRAKVLEGQQYLAQLQAQIAAGGSNGDPAKLTAGQQKVIELNEQLKTSITGVARAQKEKALAEAQVQATQDVQIQSAERQLKAVDQARAAYEHLIETTDKQAEETRQQAIGQEAANATFGKSKTAIEQSVLAQLKLQLAEADSSDSFGPKYVAALTAKTEAQERYVKALEETEFKQEKLRLDDAARDANATASSLQLELSLLGSTQLERAKIIAQRKVEIDLAKELERIDRLDLGTGGTADARREELRAKARANALIESNNAAQKSVLDEWQRTTDSINNSLTDALLRGFEAGKSLAQNFRDTLKNMFATLILRPTISAVMSPVAAGINSVVQPVVGGITNSLSSAFGFTNAGSSLAKTFGVGSGASNAAVMTDAIGDGMATVAEETAINAALVETGSAAAGLTSAFSGITGALAAMGPVGWIGLAAVAAYSLFGGSKGGPKTTSAFGPNLNSQDMIGDPTKAKELVDALNAAYAGLAHTLNLANDKLNASILISQDPKGTAQTILEVASSTANYSRGARLGGVENVGRSDAELAGALAEENVRVLFQALKQAPDLSSLYRAWLNAVGADASVAEMQAVIDHIGKAALEKQQLEAKLYDLTATDLQKLNKQRDAERVAVDETNRALLEQVYAQEDLRSALSATGNTQNQIMADLQTAHNALDQARQGEITLVQTTTSTLESSSTRLRSLSSDLRNFRDGLQFGDLSPLTPKQKYEQAASQFESTYAAAQGGDQDAMSRLSSVITEFLQASQVYNASDDTFQRDFARAQTALTLAAVKADEMATLAEAQLAIQRASLSSLQDIHGGVLTVKQAIDNMAQAVGAALNAGLNPGASNLAALTGGVTGQYVDTAVGSVYASAAGAAATGGTIYAINGQSYTMSAAVDYINNLLNAGRPTDAYYAFKSAGISLSDADKLMGWPANYAEDWARSQNLPVFHRGTLSVNRTGLALLEQGEAVVERSRNARSGSAGGGQEVNQLSSLLSSVVSEIRTLREEGARNTSAMVRAAVTAAHLGADKVVQGTAAVSSRATRTRGQAAKARVGAPA